MSYFVYTILVGVHEVLTRLPRGLVKLSSATLRHCASLVTHRDHLYIRVTRAVFHLSLSLLLPPCPQVVSKHQVPAGVPHSLFGIAMTMKFVRPSVSHTNFFSVTSRSPPACRTPAPPSVSRHEGPVPSASSPVVTRPSFHFDLGRTGMNTRLHAQLLASRLAQERQTRPPPDPNRYRPRTMAVTPYPEYLRLARRAAKASEQSESLAESSSSESSSSEDESPPVRILFLLPSLGSDHLLAQTPAPIQAFVSHGPCRRSEHLL